MLFLFIKDVFSYNCYSIRHLGLPDGFFMEQHIHFLCCDEVFLPHLTENLDLQELGSHTYASRSIKRCIPHGNITQKQYMT